MCPSGAAGTSAVLVVFIVALIAVLIAGFVIYKKKRSYFSSTIRYERTLDDADSTSIVADMELS